MKVKRILSWILTMALVLGMIPGGLFTAPAAQAAEAKEVIAIDFEALAQEVSDESWWEDLPMGSTADKTMPSAESNAQYEALLTYLEENKNWTINETVSKIANPNASAKRLHLDADDSYDWALRMYPAWLGNTEQMLPRNGLQIDLAVSGQEAGWYQLSVDAFMEGVSSTQVPSGVTPGSGYGLITVNGETVLEEMSFAGGNAVTTLKGGMVELKEGVNVIKIHATRDFSGQTVSTRRTLALNNLKFTPVKTADGPLDTLRLDFKAFAQKASTQQWWEELGDTNIDDVKVFGHTSASQNLGSRYDAYNEMLEFMAQNECWSIDEGRSKFSTPAATKRLFLDNSANACGLRYYTSRFSSQSPDYSKLVLSVDVPYGAGGLYEMDLDVIHEAVATNIAQVDGLYSGSGYGDIYVNDTLVYDEFFFGSTNNKTYRQLHELGQVQLHDGTNTVTIDMTASYVNDLVNGRRTINLCAMEFRSAETEPALVYDFAKAASVTADGGFQAIRTYEDLLVDDVESAPWHFAAKSATASAVFDTAENAALLQDGSVTFTVQVEQDGWYTPRMDVIDHVNGGAVTVQLSDGRVLGVFQTTAPVKAARTVTLNPTYLEAGEYDITFLAPGGRFYWNSLSLYAAEAPQLSVFTQSAAGDKQHRTVSVPVYAFWNGSFSESLNGLQITAEAEDAAVAQAEVITQESGTPATLRIKGLQPGKTTVTVTAQLGDVSASAQVEMTVGEPAALATFDLGVVGAQQQVSRFTTQTIDLAMVGDDGETIYPAEVQIVYELSEEGIIEIDEENHTFRTMQNGAVTLTATATAGGVSVTDSKELIVADHGENCLSPEDGSFEGDAGVSGWVTYAPGSTALNWTTAEDDGTGNMAMKITANPQVSYSETTLGSEIRLKDGHFAQLQPGHMYEISFRVRTEDLQKPAAARGGHLFVVQMYDYRVNSRSDSAILGEVLADAAPSTNTPQWTTLTYQVRAPLTHEGPIYVMPRIVLRPSDSRDYTLTGWQGSVWFDDFRMVEVGLEGVELELKNELTDTVTPTDLYVRPVTTTGSYVDIDADAVKELVCVQTTNEDVVQIYSEPARAKYQATTQYYPAVSVGLVGLNAQAELTASVSLGGFTAEGRLDMTRTDMADVLRDVQYTLDGFEAAVLRYGETAKGNVTGRSTQLEAMEEETLRSNGDVYFASSDLSVAVVDQQSGDVTCVGEGTAEITVYVMLDGILKQDTALLTVTDDTDLASIELSAPTDFVTVGNDLQLTVSGLRSSGGKAVMDEIPMAYTVDDETLATVSEAGVVTALQPGTVTVTATVGVMRSAITDSIVLELADSEALEQADGVYDFTNGRLSNIPTATLAADGIAINRTLSYLNGEQIKTVHKYGFAHNVPAGESMAFDFVVRRSGWYAVEVAGGLYSNGNFSDIFVDKNYVGTIDFCRGKNGAPYSALCQGNTIWLEAGTHTFRLTAVTAGMQYLGKFTLRATKDPNPISVQPMPQKQELLVGEQTQILLQATDANGRAFHLKAVAQEASYVNYCILTVSDAAITLDGTAATGAKPGSAVITAQGNAAGQSFSSEAQMTVSEGTVASVQLSAEQITVKPDAQPFALTAKVFGIDGTELAGEFDISFRSEDPAIASVSEDGTVTLTGEEGSVLVTVCVAENGRTVEAELWLTVTQGKTEPTVYTYEERANAQENVLKYDWAWQMKSQAVSNADFVVENLDLFYEMLIPESLPRSARLVYRSDSENYRHCPYCKTDLTAIYSHYPWIVDPITNPWKITCPVCSRDFPSNDFESYYKSGLDAQGRFDPNKADKSLLVNELYPEMGEGWGVDDGFGYDTGTVTSTGVPVVYTFIGYYVHCLFCTLGDQDVNDLGFALDSLREAYLYTGDEKYGSAGAILLSRAADLYPDYDQSRYSVNYSNSDGGNGQGKFTGAIWEGAIVGQYLTKAADAFWPSMGNTDVVEYLREKAQARGMDPELITPQYVRDHVDENILLEIKRGCEEYKIAGNFGMPQAVICYAAVALDRMPETEEMIDWAMRSGESAYQNGKYTNSGGNVMYNLVNLVDRDGFGNEVSAAYNTLWISHLSNMADALDGYDRVEGVDLWRNAKFLSLYKGYSKMIVVGRNTPLVGETGGMQAVTMPLKTDNLLTAYQKTADPEIAQALYFANGNSVAGLHADIFTKDPESGLRSAIEQAVEQYGELDISSSEMMAGYGIGIFRDGPEKYLGIDENADEFSASWMYFGSTNASHSHLEALSMDLYAYGLSLSSTMGYPLAVVTTDPERMQWMLNSISHNLVVVDDAAQSSMSFGGFPMHFDDAGKVKVMDAEASAAYSQADIYRRTMVSVLAPDGQPYTVDFFRVLGGSEHVYSFHAASEEDPAVEGLNMTKQPMGTYAGADIPFGANYTLENKDVTMNTGSGYSWLDGVSRDADPETTFTVDYAVADFRHQLATSDGVRLRMTMLSEEPMTEVALANGHPPQNGTNPESVEYVLVRRSGENGMDTLFTTVFEPYWVDRQIEASELVDVTLVDGTELATDTARAIKVTMKDGRVDYIVYATNAGCTYRVDDLFEFCGFVGVCSYYEDALVYAYGNEAAYVAGVVEEDLTVITGTVTDFTEGLSLDGYTMRVKLDQTVTEEDFEGRYIYVENDGERNAAYRIYGVQLEGSTAVLDLHGQTLVRSFADANNMDLGYVHNIAAGQSLRIPLSADFDAQALLTMTPDQVVRTGSKLSLTTGVGGAGVTYEAEGLVSGMKFNASTGLLTWTPSKAQAGRYPITIKAVDTDGTVLGTMSFVIYAVTYTGSTYDASVCTHAKAVTYGDEIVCAACGTISKATVEEETKFDIAGSNMTLGNELKLNVMVKASDLTDGEYTAKITHNGVTTEQVFTKYNASYYFVTLTVSAKQMADTITVEVFNEAGEAVSNVYETSVRDYAMKIMNNPDLGVDVKCLVVDMLNYGAAAQEYFAYNEEDLANNKLNAAQKELATAAVECENEQVKGKNFYGTNLSLEDKILLNMFFTNITEDMTAEISYTSYNGTTVSVQADDISLYVGSVYKIAIDELVLPDAFSPVTVTVYDSDGTIHASATDSVESYVARSGSSDLNDAIMKFASSARIYLG